MEIIIDDDGIMHKVYTKADMVAMLEEIQSEIREYHEIGCDEDCNNCRMVGCVEPVNVIKDLDIIQQKIDALKGGKDEKSSSNNDLNSHDTNRM